MAETKDTPEPTCGECGVRTGGGAYCYQHAPYTVWPLKDGSFRSDRGGMKHIWLDAPPSLESEHRDALAAQAQEIADLKANHNELATLAGSAIVLATIDTLAGERPVSVPDHALTEAVWSLVQQRDQVRSRLTAVEKAFTDLRALVVQFQQGTVARGKGAFERGEIAGCQGTLAVVLKTIDKSLAALTPTSPQTQEDRP